MIANEYLLLQLPGMVFWKDANSTYVDANQAFIEFSHAPYANIDGFTDFELPWANYAAIYQHGDKATIQKGQHKSF